MAEALKLEPEVAALLREVAADPHSSLLRARPLSQQVDLFRREETWSSRSWMLNHAEAELVRVHREQLAWVLRELCLRELYEAKGEQAVLNPYDVQGRRHEVAADSVIAREVETAERFENRAPEVQLALTLAAAVRAPSGRRPQVADLAAAAHRLVPSNQARLLAAIDYARGNAQRTAIEIARGVLTCSPKPDHRAVAWEVIGRSYSQRGHTRQAHDSYANGCEHAAQQYLMLLNGSMFALQLGLAESASEKLRRLTHMIPHDHPGVSTFIQAQVLAREEGQWKPSTEGQIMSQRLADAIGGVAGRIAHAFA